MQAENSQNNKINVARQTLQNWIKLFRAECQSLHAILRGGLRDNALHNSIFHKQGMICCRLLGLWYRNYKKEICFHFIQQVSLFRKKRRQQKSVARWKKNKERKRQETEDSQPNDNPPRICSKRQEKIQLWLEKKKKSKQNERIKKGKKKSLRHKTAVEKHLAVFVATTKEYRLRRRILLELMKAGWACAAELQLLRANTGSVVVALMAGLARMHFLMSSKINRQDEEGEDAKNKLTRNDGGFGSWLLV